MRNKYIVNGKITKIELKRRSTSEILYAIIDTDDLKILKNYDVSFYPEWRDDINSYYVTATQYKGMAEGKPKYKRIVLHGILANDIDGLGVDHINHDTLDNRKSNLRIRNENSNSINRLSANKNSSTGERNVSWSKKTNKYIVQLQVNGKNVVFGKFSKNEFSKAVNLAKRKRKEIYGI